MLNKIKNKCHQRKAVTMLETALVFPLILMFISIMIVGAQLVTNKMIINYAVSVAAREASDSTSEAQASNKAKSTAQSIITANGIAVDSTQITCTPIKGDADTSDMRITITSSIVNLFPTYNGTNFSNKKNTVGTSLVFTWSYNKKGHSK